MDRKISKTSILIKGMTCSSCELKVESTLKKLNGVLEVKVSLAKGRADVTFDEQKINAATMINAIKEADYEAQEIKNEVKSYGKKNNEPKNNNLRIDQLIGLGIILFALYIIIKRTVGFNFIPQIDQSMGYGLLFAVGALTSLHCIAMCGGINLSQCVGYNTNSEDKMNKLMPSLMYNAGRVVSYTIIGGIVGAIGSVVSFSGAAKGAVSLLAGIFMIIMGLNMLNIFPWLRRFNIRMPKAIGQKIYSGKVNKGPFIIGLLNGLMPCGPLQAMQLYALGTGSFAAGAAAMFFFSLGTVPLMFGLGAISTILSKKFTGNLMKVSAILVVILGVGMIGRGMSLAGVNTVMASTGNSQIAKINGNVQTVSIELGSNSYQPIVVQKGIPVRFIINAKQENINGCNSPLVIPKYSIEKELKAGENVIEFTPDSTGTISYSCWMGMVRSSIKVVDDIGQVKDSDVTDLNNTPAAGAGGCCGTSANAKSLSSATAKDIYVAKPENGAAVVNIKVDEKGYTPNIIVVQKGTKVKFKFDPKSLNQCNYAVTFPEFGGGLDLSKGELETPELDMTEDFGFSCWMGMLQGYVKVVDDINHVDNDTVLTDASNYTPPAGAGGGCCGKSAN